MAKPDLKTYRDRMDRSVADAQEPDNGAADYLLSGKDGAPQVQIIKTGEIVGSKPAAE